MLLTLLFVQQFTLMKNMYVLIENMFAKDFVMW